MVGGDADPCLLIVGEASGQMSGYELRQFFGTFTFHDRSPVAGHKQSAADRPDSGVKPYRCPRAEHIPHIVAETGCAPAAANYGVAEFTRFAQHSGFDLPESILPFFGEYPRDAHAEALLDVEIKVNELISEFLGKRAPEGGFPGRHITDKKYSHDLNSCYSEVILRQGYPVLWQR